jgi:hypothetical protein
LAITVTAEGTWQDAGVLVVQKGATLPDRCVRCNGRANGSGYRGSFYWHPPALYLLILCGLLVYLIVALIVRKGAVVFVGLCPDHFAQRRRSRIGSALLAVVGVVFLLAAIEYGQFFGWTGLAMVLGGAIWGTIGGRSLSPVRIDDNFARFRGADPDYLAMLPTWSALV